MSKTVTVMMVYFNWRRESTDLFMVGVKWVMQSGRPEWPEDLRSLEESEQSGSGAPTQSPGTHLGEPRGVQWRKLIVSWRRRETSLRCWAHRNPAKLRKTRKYAKLSLSLPITLISWFGCSQGKKSCCVGLFEPKRKCKPLLAHRPNLGHWILSGDSLLPKDTRGPPYYMVWIIHHN